MRKDSSPISLTRLLEGITDKSTLLKRSLPPHFNVLSHPLVNPYPKWVKDTKSWALFGTFSDYVIRKIIVNLFHEKIQINHIIAENAHPILFNALENIHSIHKMLLSSQITKDYSAKELYDFYHATGTFIDNYKDKIVKWKDSLYEIFCFSHLDKIYREMKLSLPLISKKLVHECIPFFENIEQWLQFKFKNANKIYLNPTLGHKLTLSADADLVIGSTLYDIKTVLYPEKYITEDFHQLYGYVALFEYLKKHAQIQDYKILECLNIDTIGFIFPLFLQEITMDISKWKIRDRLKYLKKLLSFK